MRLFTKGFWQSIWYRDALYWRNRPEPAEAECRKLNAAWEMLNHRYCDAAIALNRARSGQSAADRRLKDLLEAHDRLERSQRHPDMRQLPDDIGTNPYKVHELPSYDGVPPPPIV